MAGIGFDLRRLVSEDAGVLSRIRAYASAGLISAGPWIVTMLSLWMVAMSREWLTEQDAANFLALVTYSFAFSLITVGGLQMAVTRWLADALYLRRYDTLVPGFAAALAGVALVQAVTALAFTYACGFAPRLAVVVTVLYVLISLSWIALVWLTVIRQYERILFAYLGGMLAFWLLLHALGTGHGLLGALSAYAGGLALTLTLMVGLILRGTERPGDESVHLFRSLRRYRQLLVIGLLYSASIWVDKLVFWFAEGTGTLPLIRFHPLYDTCFFLGYLTVVPALSINLVHLETSFYERYRGYFAAIAGGFPLAQVQQTRRDMVADLREGAVRLLRVQGAITVACVLFAALIVQAVGLPEYTVRVFRFACVGALFHVLFLITILIQLYFDMRREALASSLLFLVLNAGLAAWSVRAGVSTYGMGYALAALASLVAAFLLLRRRLQDLEYLTFTGTSIAR